MPAENLSLLEVIVGDRNISQKYVSYWGRHIRGISYNLDGAGHSGVPRVDPTIKQF